METNLLSTTNPARKQPSTSMMLILLKASKHKGRHMLECLSPYNCQGQSPTFVLLSLISTEFSKALIITGIHH